MKEERRVIHNDCLQNYRETPVFKKKPNIDEWLTYWLEHYIKPTAKPNTYANFHSYIHAHILPMIGDYKLMELKTIELQYYIDYKLEKGRKDGRGGLSLKTVKEHVSLLNNAYRKAIALQIIEFNPMQGIVFPKMEVKEISVLDIDEQNAITNAIACEYSENSLVPVLLGIYGGLRIGEVSALRIDDIDFERRLIRIDESLNRMANFYPDGMVRHQLVYGTPKSNKTRYVPMNEDIYRALQMYFKTMPQALRCQLYSPLFLNSRHCVMEPKNITYHFLSLLKSLGIEGYHFHCLRHTFATRALELNIDIKSCSQILGHSTTKITLDRYTHVSTNHLHNEMKKLNNNTLMRLRK